MEHCRGQAAMVYADHVNLWWGVELLIPLLKHTKYYYFCVKSMCRPMPTQGKFCLLMYLRKALLDQRPISMIMNMGHSPRYIAMVAPDLIECVPTSSLLMPSFTSPMAPTASLNAFIMCVDVTCLRCPFTVTIKMGES
jgi:hypothetical protein